MSTDKKINIMFVDDDEVTGSVMKRNCDSAKYCCSVFENAEECVIITDREANILNVNPAFCHVTGYSRNEVIGENPRLLHSGRQDATFYQSLWHDLLHNNRWEGEIWNKRKDGKIYPEWLSFQLYWPKW